jgi:hypothetical protein
MTDIYEQGTVTIAATKARDGSYSDTMVEPMRFDLDYPTDIAQPDRHPTGGMHALPASNELDLGGTPRFEHCHAPFSQWTQNPIDTATNDTYVSNIRQLYAYV